MSKNIFLLRKVRQTGVLFGGVPTYHTELLTEQGYYATRQEAEQAAGRLAREHFEQWQAKREKAKQMVAAADRPPLITDVLPERLDDLAAYQSFWPPQWEIVKVPAAE